MAEFSGKVAIVAGGALDYRLGGGPEVGSRRRVGRDLQRPRGPGRKDSRGPWADVTASADMKSMVLFIIDFSLDALSKVFGDRW
jgi:hypothetical protein